ncbi:MAG: hypothetical protein ACQEQF_12890 [Bacillota bacterium]
MADNYLKKRIKNNWQTLLILILAIIFFSIVIKNISQIPYKNQHKMTSTFPLTFEYEGKKVKGYVYLSYWVETDRSVDKNLTTKELDRYLQKHGYIELEKYEDKLISSLKNYSLKEINNHWIDDYDFFKQNDTYHIKNDQKLYNDLNKINFDIGLDYELKKSIFVYLEDSEFGKKLES